MVSHVVLFSPRADLSDADRQALLDAFSGAILAIPTVRGVRIGRRVTHGAGYEAQMPAGLEYLVSIDFDDLDGLQSYLRHPAHEALGTRFNASIASGLVFDYGTGGIEFLDGLTERRP